MNSFIESAKKTFLAYENPYQSVEKVFPYAINVLETQLLVQYVGVKNVPQIPLTLLKTLEPFGFVLHTLDVHSVGGRAIDTLRKNPITGQPMTGSSSGTAMNVFLHINDLGIGTDGGGSVLAPALALNLFSLISSDIEAEHLAKTSSRLSTDGIPFSASIGFMARDLPTLEKATTAVLPIHPISTAKLPLKVLLSDEIPDFELRHIHLIPDIVTETTHFPSSASSREEAIHFLNTQLNQWDILIGWEGPIDYQGFGDSILGHFDDKTRDDQARSNKNLLRVVNMVSGTALSYPSANFASGLLIMSKRDIEATSKVFYIAKNLPTKTDSLMETYYGNLDAYFSEGFIG